jgi:outer membrane protein assembly factor BamD (BamD/ComL family)
MKNPLRDLAVSWPRPRTIVIAVAIVVGALGIAAGLWYWQSTEARRAAEAYAVALARLQATRAPQTPTEARAAAIRELEIVLQSYPSAPMAAQAAYELGGLRYAERQYAAARKAYEIARAQARSGTLTMLARLGIGYTWEGERNFAKAAEAYGAAVSQLHAGDAFFEEALLDLARAQELAGRKDDAVATYRRILKEAPTARRADEVRSRLASLGAGP